MGRISEKTACTARVIQSPSQREYWRTIMGEVIKFVSREEFERTRLNRGSRARDNSMLPPAVSVSAPREQKNELADS
jgi:hypothetical protein